MLLDADFIAALKPLDPPELIQRLESEQRPHFDTEWSLRNEIKPVDLYCYLYARFGPPNGVQNFLRGDTSENLIHWEWSLHAQGRIVFIQGHNFRTEILVSGGPLEVEELGLFVTAIKDTFPEHGRSMGLVRKALEHWVEFVNPYQRIRHSIESLTKELDALDIGEPLKDLRDYESAAAWSDAWKAQGSKISRAIGLCFGIRSMLPVMAEAFVNLLLYWLMKKSLKKDDRLRENIIRQPIDIRIKSLSHNCVGFSTEVDYANDACRQYHSLVNERNDLLHGNVVIDKLKFNELFFNGKVPVFQSYLSMSDRAFGVAQRSVGIDLVKKEREAVEKLIKYITSCLTEQKQKEIRFVSECRELGFNLDDGRLGVLFSGPVFDTYPGPKAARPS